MRLLPLTVTPSKCAEQTTWPGRRILVLYFTGLYLLAVVFLSPHAGYREGRSFFIVAQSSPWNQWWDWPAAWCSVKIILLSTGAFSVLAALWMLLKILNRQSLARMIRFLSAAPGLGVLIGIYYLVKALL
jgi:hypothetical protein